MAITERAVCEQIRDYLNSNVTNLNTSRATTGSQFFTSYQGVNLNRPDTFPKGEVFLFEDSDVTDNLGRTRRVVKNNSYGVFCYVGASQKYNNGSQTFQDEGLCELFMQEVRDAFNPQDMLGSVTPKLVSVTQDPTIRYITEAGHSYLAGLVIVNTTRRE